METRKLFVVMAVVCGLCAILVTAASNVGSNRPEREFTGAPPQSSLAADYSVDLGVQRTAPLKPEIAEAAARDMKALGLALSALPAGSEGPASQGGVGSDLAFSGEASVDTSNAQAAVQEDLSAPRKSSVPVTETAIAVLAIAALIGTAWFFLRPSRD